MKAPWRTHRRSANQDGPGISLFPFLAVLICTMGALVPLLLAITRTARQQAEAAAISKMAERGAELKTQREDVQWRIEQLKKTRARAESQLADARLELGHLEDHSRRLRERLAQFQATGHDLENVGNSDQKRLAQSQAELEQVRAQIGTAQQQLAQAHQAAAGRRRSYAVVPYEGPNQTRRQPIYLECRGDALVLQPEGIRLTDSDFDEPLGPGNPLAVALRAAREYMLARRDFDPQVGEPYPLLLVRPEGINAYYAARAAMKSWGFDFGYELVADGWKLAYPPPDPRLADVMRQVVAAARVNQARLAAAAPREYGKRSKVVYHASPQGGFVREGGSSDDGDQGYRSASAAGAVGQNGGQGTGVGGQGTDGGPGGSGAVAGNPYLASAGGTGGTGGAGGTGGTGGAPVGAGTGNAAGGSVFGGGGGTGAAGDNIGSVFGSSGNRGAGGPGTGAAAGAAGSSNGGPALAGNGSAGGTNAQNTTGGGVYSGGNAPPGGAQLSGAGGPGNSAQGNSAQGGSGTGTSVMSPNGQPNTAVAGGRAERPDGYVVGQPAREQPAPTASSDAVASGDMHSRVLRPGDWEPTPDPPPKKRDDKDEKDDDNPSSKHSKSLASKRGADWGLRDTGRGSVGVVRPIRIECYGDHLMVVSERNPDANKVIAMGPRTAAAIDPLISAVWERMETWGIAGRGMFWRPVLQVYVAPDADRRFAELSTLLEGSGLMVERK
jgi:hypothetical protein